MNYLAHIYLADKGNEQSVLGNFLGDFVNISTERVFDDAIRKGIHMHRKVDSFTDSNPVFHRSRKRISPPNRRYAGVLIDIFYDHYLAKNWRLYSKTPLEEYAAAFYTILERNIDLLPLKVKGMMPYMIRENWFVSYQEVSGIERPLERIARRFAKSRRPLIDPINELLNNYNSLEEDFHAFFPIVAAYANQLIDL